MPALYNTKITNAIISIFKILPAENLVRYSKNMEASADYKYFGLLAAIILLCGLAFLAVKWPQGKHATFSQHAAAQKFTVLYYILLFSVTLPILIAFFVGWFVPYFNVSIWFSVCIIASAITQLACTLVPEVGGRKTTYHRLLAGTSALLLLPPLAFILAADSIPAIGRYITLTSLLIMVAIVATLAVRKNKRSYNLLLQIGYFGAFFAAILYVSYLT